jgi:hypothetical protein
MALTFNLTFCNAGSNFMKNKYHLIVLTLLLLFLLSACDGGLLTRSAQEMTGGNGAGLSEYQD